MKLFKILRKTQEQLKQAVVSELKIKGYKNIINTKDYVFAKGNIPIMLVAHLDTVHKELPTVYFDKKEGVLWSPQGIGGDDRCGVYAILKIIERLKPYVLFTTDEETGATGARAFTKEIDGSELEDLKFIIEIDRRGNNQAVFYDCGNEDFQKYILSYGFDLNYGSFSDISVLSPYYDIASVNLSAGYYSEHTKMEYIVLKDLQNTINKIIKILKDKSSVQYDYQEKPKYVPNYYNYRRTKYWKEEYIENANGEFEYFEDAVKDLEELNDDSWYKRYGFKKCTKEQLEKKKICFEESLKSLYRDYYDGYDW